MTETMEIYRRLDEVRITVNGSQPPSCPQTLLPMNNTRAETL